MMDKSLIDLLEAERTFLKEKFYSEREISERKTYLEDTDMPKGVRTYHTDCLADAESRFNEASQALDKVRSSIAKYLKEILAEYT